ncbi:MAG: DNA polymerase IV [Candidatus Anstonellales archaeon]
MKLFLHIDLNQFFVACERLRNNNLINKPVVIGVYSGRSETSGAVATASYEARKYGIKSGMPLSEAYKIAKEVKEQEKIEIIFLKHDFEYYEQLSNQIFDDIKKISNIQQISIDECFIELDNSNYEEAERLAKNIEAIIRNHGLECSIGIANTQITAKIASGMKKGILLVKNGRDFISDLDISEMPGIGKKTEKILRERGINKIGELANMNIAELIKLFGEKHGKYLFNASKNLEIYYLEKNSEKEKQISRIITLRQDSYDYEYLKINLEQLIEELYNEIQKEKFLIKTIQISGITNELKTFTKRKTLLNYTDNPSVIKKNAFSLLEEFTKKLKDEKILLRRIGISFSDLQYAEKQTKLF